MTFIIDYILNNTIIRTALLMLIAASTSFGACQYAAYVSAELKEDLLFETVKYESAIRVIDIVKVEKSISEESVASTLDKRDKIDVKLDKIDDSTRADIITIKAKLESNNENKETVHNAVAILVIDGMWATYCSTTSDEGSCT